MVLGQSVYHLGTTGRIAHDGDFRLSCNLHDLVDEGRHVVLAHVCPSEVPVLLQRLRRVILVQITVLATSVVAHPNVIASLCQLSRQSRAQWIEPAKPGLRRLTRSVLHVDRRLVRVGGECLAFDLRDAEQCQKPAIQSFHCVGLPFVPVTVADVRPGLVFASLLLSLGICKTKQCDGCHFEEPCRPHE